VPTYLSLGILVTTTTLEGTLKYYFGDRWDLINAGIRHRIYKAIDTHDIKPSEIKGIECEDKIMIITTKGFLIFPTLFYG